jgi:crotonobetainyl-CoA:carnitine CoA-transferase CaiB-like acyl-CoA transferase
VVYTDKHWRAFSAMAGEPDLVDTDPRFKTQETRTQHAEDMGRYLKEKLPQKTTAEWLAALRAADIPAHAVNRIEDLFGDPHLEAVKLFSEMEHPTEGTLKVARFPVRFSKTPASIRRLAPNLGEHTGEIVPGRAKTRPRGGTQSA